MTEDNLFDLAELFKVFGDTTRIKILYQLTDEDMSVGDLARCLGMTDSAVSHQLRILKQAKLVRSTRYGKSIVYSLSDDHVKTIMDMGIDHILE